MFDGLRLNYYRKLSKKLKKEIEILKNSYEVVDSHIDLTKNLSEYNDTEKSIIKTFGSFCKENGFSETERVGTLTYGEIKKKIQDRVAFLEKQNDSIEKFISSRDELEELKEGTLSEDKARAIIAEARGKGFVSGTEESKKYIQKRKKEEIQKEKDDKKKSISDAKTEIRKNKKENGFGKVVNSITGPVGNWFYNNIYVPVQNVNVDLRNHKILNLGIKGVLLAGYVFGCASLSLTGFPLVASIVGGAIAGYNTIANTFFRKVPEKAKRREKAPSLKESWFRFRKSRGNGKLSVQDTLYKNIDLSKAGTRGSAERESEDEIPEEREREHEAAREMPEVPVDEHVEEREVPEEIVETPEVEERDEEAHEIPRIEEAAEEMPEVPEYEESKTDEVNRLLDFLNRGKTVSKYNHADKNRLVLVRDTIKMLNVFSKTEDKDLINTKVVKRWNLNEYEEIDRIKIADECIKRFCCILDDFDKGKITKSKNANPDKRMAQAFYDLLIARKYFAEKGTEFNEIYEKIDNIIQNEISIEFVNRINQYLSFNLRVFYGDDKKIEDKLDETRQKS